MTYYLVNVLMGGYDILNPLWFFIIANPFSWCLDNTRGHGFAIKYYLWAKSELTHMMYLDNIKLYADTDDRFSQLRIVYAYSRNIRMEFVSDPNHSQRIQRAGCQT